jgi:nucleoside-diphosphate-sugar epimerase
MLPVRKTAKWVLRRFPGLVMGAYQRSALAKRLMRSAESAIRQAPTPGEFRLYGRTVDFPTAKAERLLYYRPAFTAAEGIDLSVRWLAHHGFLGRAAGRAVSRG